MRGYSKMSFTAKSRSMDFSELTQSSPPPPPPPPNKDQEEGQQVKMKNHEEENIINGGVLNEDKFGVVLRRNFSSSSSSSQRIRAPDVLKRAFSMRRSSSVADGYWRIHDTGDQDVVQEEEDDDEQQQQDMKRSSKRKGMKFFKAYGSIPRHDIKTQSR
ncbi:hypothetical protein J5N97_012730 [Dioscorea zingiberensis]|uniref:Uncharacterized protein n=1 Tax=Dioscorea zingiberensis TaxID=325984 RepID=A0A9D5CPG8_9LILI|nr:hypothetical protein J5N97_012730 [Dioscorea zingiberensis]